MTNHLKILSVLGLTIFTTLFGIIEIAHANPLQVAPIVQTAVSTTTPSYMTAGTATTTLVFDSYIPGVNKISDEATLLVQNVASSTSSILNIAIQYSQDGIDWYSDNGSVASSTNPLPIQTANSYTWTAAGTATTSKALFLQTPVRFTRAVFTVPAGAAAGGVWAQIVAARQASE